MQITDWTTNSGATASPDGTVTLTNDKGLATSRIIRRDEFGGVHKFDVDIWATGQVIPHAGLRFGSKVIDKWGAERNGGGTDVAYWHANGEVVVRLTIKLDFDTDAGFRVVLARPIDSPNQSANVTIRNVTGQPWSSVTPGLKEGYNHPDSHVAITNDGFMLVDGKLFVPHGILPDKKRSRNELRSLANQGWNTYMWAMRGNAEDAIAVGMKFMFPLAWFVDDRGGGYKDWDLLEESMEWLSEDQYFKHCIGIYFDNEAYGEHEVIQQAIHIVRRGSPLPIYALQGNYGLAPKFAQLNWMDCTGSYMYDPDDTGGATGMSRINFLNGSIQQTKPVVFAQRNGDPTRYTLDQAGIAYSGVCYWGDTRRRVEQESWFGDYPGFAEDFTNRVTAAYEEGGPVEPPIEPPVTDNYHVWKAHMKRFYEECMSKGVLPDDIPF